MPQIVWIYDADLMYFIFFGSFSGKVLHTLCITCQPLTWSSDWWILANKYSFISLTPAWLRVSWSLNFCSASVVSPGINNGTRWLFPFPLRYVTFKDFIRTWSKSSKSSDRCLSIHLSFSASLHSVRYGHSSRFTTTTGIQ